MPVAARQRDVPPVRFVCPMCKTDVVRHATAYSCEPCRRSYPLLFGIADFRLRSDRYLTLEEERAKARQLHEFGLTSTFNELVSFYYAITNDVPEELAARYQAYIQAGPARGERILSRFPAGTGPGSLIDLGCGAGGLLVASASRFDYVVGTDIALRWLVICAKRLAESGIEATLVCADVEALPFPAESFTHAVAADLLENVYDRDRTMHEISRHLKPGGVLWLSATNRFALGPHPLVGLWLIGFLPGPIRARVVRAIRGVDSLRYVNLVSPLSVARMSRSSGLHIVGLEPSQAPVVALDAYSRVDRALIRLYRFMCGVPFLRRLLVLVGPAFEMLCRKTDGTENAADS